MDNAAVSMTWLTTWHWCGWTVGHMVGWRKLALV